jgi:uncharacterized membrane protein YozB (DUF420 family)
LVVVITIAVMGLVTLLQYLPAEMRPSADFAKVLPLTNAVLNSLVSVALVLGFLAIKSGKKGIHQAYMLTAFILSTVFLLSYVTYHTCTEHTNFGGVLFHLGYAHCFGSGGIANGVVYDVLQHEWEFCEAQKVGEGNLSDMVVCFCDWSHSLFHDCAVLCVQILPLLT